MHLYPRWVLFRGNGTFICTSRQPLSIFAPISLAMVFIHYKDFKALNITQFGALAGWSDTAYGCSKSKVHAAAAEADGPNLPFQAQLH